jgi:hypothetical protein
MVKINTTWNIEGFGPFWYLRSAAFVGLTRASFTRWTPLSRLTMGLLLIFTESLTLPDMNQFVCEGKYRFVIFLQTFQSI